MREFFRVAYLLSKCMTTKWGFTPLLLNKKFARCVLTDKANLVRSKLEDRVKGGKRCEYGNGY